MCADPPAEPHFPAEADLPRPVNQAEADAALAFVLWNQAVLAVLRLLIDRAEIAQEACLESIAADEAG